MAIAHAERAVTYADDALMQFISRSTHADALHQSGHWEPAETLFRKAEEIEAGFQPRYPLLYSLHGFHYCDLLLAASERAAWRRMLNLPNVSHPSSLRESCRAVSERVARTLQRVTPLNYLLDIALDNLSLGRASLYAAVLEGVVLDRFDPCRESLQHAVDGLHSAGEQTHLPRGLLTRAWLRFLTGARTGPESAQSDLNEAFEIAERGPMALFLADIHLHRARLLGLSKDRPADYPWTSPQADLAEARRLIEKHGYWRRKEELEDAEAAALAVSGAP